VNKKRKVEIKICEIVATNELAITGIGTAKLKGYYVVTQVLLKELQRALDILKALHKGEEDPYVDIAIAGDYPLVIGHFSKKDNAIAGVLIAPKECD